MRVISIFLARAISCSRVSRGISPICVRYMRTGSSMRLVEASASSASRFRSTASSSSSSSVSSSAALALAPFSGLVDFSGRWSLPTADFSTARRDARRRLLIFAHVVLVDELDAHLVDHHQQGIELVRRDDFIGKPFVQLFVSQIAAGGAQVQKGLNAEINFFLRTRTDKRRFDRCHVRNTTFQGNRRWERHRRGDESPPGQGIQGCS